eukprot:3312148-Heterocapsa_arctica.AAC.1
MSSSSRSSSSNPSSPRLPSTSHMGSSSSTSVHPPEYEALVKHHADGSVVIRPSAPGGDGLADAVRRHLRLEKERIKTGRRAARAAALAAKPPKNRFKRLGVSITGSITFLNPVIGILPIRAPSYPRNKRKHNLGSCPYCFE